MEAWLTSHGYRNVSVVMEKGEYSRREWLFDIYPVTEDLPVRIEFFGEEIDLVRTFDIESQRSIKEINSIEIFPAKEGEPTHNLIDNLIDLRDFDVFVVDNHPTITSLQKSILISHLPFVGEGINAGEITIKGMGIMPEERKGINDIPGALKKSRQTGYLCNVVKSSGRAPQRDHVGWRHCSANNR